jgi:hypothetical protein
MQSKNNEIEVKYKITNDQLKKCLLILAELGFINSSNAELVDSFLEIEKTELGWNFVRLRSSDGKFIQTAKKWEMVSGVKCRIEDEGEINELEYKKLKENSKITYNKIRNDYKGKFDGMEVTVSFDSIDEDVFIEAETFGELLETDKIKLKLKRYLNSNLGIDTQKEAPTMLDYVLSKQNK